MKSMWFLTWITIEIPTSSRIKSTCIDSSWFVMVNHHVNHHVNHCEIPWYITMFLHGFPIKSPYTTIFPMVFLIDFSQACPVIFPWFQAGHQSEAAERKFIGAAWDYQAGRWDRWDDGNFHSIFMGETWCCMVILGDFRWFSMVIGIEISMRMIASIEIYRHLMGFVVPFLRSELLRAAFQCHLLMGLDFMGCHGIITNWKNMVLMGVGVRIEPLKNQLGFSVSLIFAGKILKKCSKMIV